MNAIDPTAVVAAGAKIGTGALIGPYCVIGPAVVLGNGCRLVAHVHVAGRTTIGPGTVVYPFASLGTPPQSLKYRGGPTGLVIGADCDIREGVTVNIGTEDGRGTTEIGDRCFMMAGSHVAHDCVVGNDVIFANNAVLGGHVTVGDHVFLGGQAAVRQFVRIGEGAMIAGISGVRADVVPWSTAQGQSALIVGLNVVGLRRRGFGKGEIHRLRGAFRELFFGAGEFRGRLAAVEARFAADRLIGSIVAFIRSGTRPLTMARQRVSPPALEEDQ